jgi:magnesium-transporting ATPase (P-type)
MEHELSSLPLPIYTSQQQPHDGSNCIHRDGILRIHTDTSNVSSTPATVNGSGTDKHIHIDINDKKEMDKDTAHTALGNDGIASASLSSPPALGPSQPTSIINVNSSISSPLPSSRRTSSGNTATSLSGNGRKLSGINLGSPPPSTTTTTKRQGSESRVVDPSNAATAKDRVLMASVNHTQGLTAAAVDANRTKYGSNDIPTPKQSKIMLFLSKFNNTSAWMLEVWMTRSSMMMTFVGHLNALVTQMT